MSTGYHADEIVFVRREKAGPVASAWEFRQRIGATELATPFSGEKAFQPTIAHVAATRPAVHALGMKRISVVIPSVLTIAGLVSASDC